MRPNEHLYERECPNCGENFSAKRLNQRHCGPQCRAQHNNFAAKGRRDSLAEITAATNAILWKNREALAKFSERGIVKLDDLLREGFQTNFITRFEQIESGQNKFFCYDVGYTFVDASTLKIIT